MSLLIKGLEIPEDGEYDLTVYIGDLHGSPNTKCIAIVDNNTGEGKHYRLADVPTLHGKLIDADEQILLAKKWIDHPDPYISKRNKDFVYFLEKADTVIEAEK